MRINHNISALNTVNRLAVNSSAAAKNIEKLSSGLRINRAADDAAGLSISEKMRGQIRGLDMAARNSQDGISLIQTAEGALSSVSDMLGRIKELATQASNGTYDTNDLSAIDSERAALASQINDTMTNTKFNGITLLNGSGSVTLQIGQTAGQVLVMAGASYDLTNVYTAINTMALTTITTASAALATIDFQINAVSSARSALGANQNRLDYTISNLNTVSENLTASESQIRDVDMAKEMMNFTKNNILSQAAQAMLAQANQQPQGVLQLLR